MSMSCGMERMPDLNEHWMENFLSSPVMYEPGTQFRYNSVGSCMLGAAVEKAFEQGINYLYWGSARRGRFGQAIRNLAAHRGRFVLVVQSYSPAASLLGISLERALRELRFEYADVLLLGMWGRVPPPRFLDAFHRLKERGLVRHLGLSTHTRKLVPTLASRNDVEVIHFRYNAAHPGAEQDIFPHLPPVDRRPGLVSFTATSWGQLMKSRKIPHDLPRPTAVDCYRFVLTRPEVDVCMTGPATAEHMDQALEALRRGPMPEDELAWMRRVGRAVSGKPA
jgi:aryl-alcohol dehydrogenase-like predicted oxidoreductase